MKILKTVCLTLLTYSMFASAYSAKLESIEATDNKTINVATSTGVTLSTEQVNAEIKVLKDLPISFAWADLEDPKKVVLDISEEITPNTSYNLIGLIGSDSNIDFTTGENLSDSVAAEYKSALETQEIVNVVVVDSRTIELTFSQDLTETDFEFKLLVELAVESVNPQTPNMFNVLLSDSLQAQSSYIFMVLSLEDAENNTVLLDEDLNDFVTPDILEQKSVGEENSELAPLEEMTLETPSAEEVIEEEVEMLAAEDTGNLVEVAESVNETPETWAATNVLILLTFLLTSFLFIRKKVS